MKKKIALMVTSLVLVVAMAVGGTLAYLVSSTQTLTNTFTVGDVKIKLDEAKVDENGQATSARVEANDQAVANSYLIFPGAEFDKDPTVTVLAKSEESYVRMMVTVAFDKALTESGMINMPLENIITGYDATKWARVAYKVADDAMSITYEYRYVGTESGTVAKSDSDTVLPDLFTGITVPDDFDAADLEYLNGMDIIVKAHAIQAATFADADAAWEAFDDQMT